MKKIISIAMIIITCLTAMLSVQAAEQKNNTLTQLTLNEPFKSNVYYNNPDDYYTFTIEKAAQIIVELDGVAMNRKYTMILHGNGIEDTSATENIGETMYIIKDLKPGTYFVDVNSDFRGRIESFETDYTITIADDKKNTFLYEDMKLDFKTIFVNDDFENSDISNWLDGFRPHATYGNKTIKQDENGKYLSFTPVDSSQYYIFEAKDVYSTEILYSQFDIKFPSTNMELQARQTTSNLDVNFNMAARIRKTAYYLEYYSNGKWYKFNNEMGGWLQLKNVSKWYRMYITMNIKANTYNIYLIDKDSNSVISKAENISFGEHCTYISYYAFSSKEEMCIDNVSIGNVNSTININGRYYVQIPLKDVCQYRYRVAVGDYDWADDVVWSVNDINGVSIDNSTGMLEVSHDAKPGPVLISAYKKYYPWVRTTFYIDLRK